MGCNIRCSNLTQQLLQCWLATACFATVLELNEAADYTAQGHEIPLTTVKYKPLVAELAVCCRVR